MARDDRPPSFQFYPADWLSSAAVASMTAEETGGYIHLLAHAWLQPEPGVLPDDDDLLARLSRLGERWQACRCAIRRAFAERRGMLVQQRMVEERACQRERYLQAQKGALITNARRWGSVAQRPDSESLSGRYRVTPSSSSSSSSSKESKKNTCSTRAARSSGGGEPEGFPEWYESYPRHIARRAAARAYSSALKRAKAEELSEGVMRYKANLNGTPPDKIKHPATWLNGDCWLDDSGSVAAVEPNHRVREASVLDAYLRAKARREAQ